MQAIWSASQIQGGRDYQEDFLAVIENDTVFSIDTKQGIEPGLLAAHQSLYLLADGMGGMGHGDIAASAVVDVFRNSFLAKQQLGIAVADNLHESLLTANQEIANRVEQNPELKNMGCTLIALLWDSHLATVQWLSVGDSLLGLMRDGQWQELNEKHIWRNLLNQRLLAGETIDEQELATHGDALYCAVDGTELSAFELKELSIQANDLIVIASDGLEILSSKRIQAILHSRLERENADSPLGVAFHYIDGLRQQLFSAVAACENAYQDNTSAIVIGFYEHLSVD
ncbi:MAG: SpoIIE family protein phosphatase [Methyloprofundus sp.]|nr:SpoIIE family protein phosphatase [Methyloprofundus sp.]